MSYLHGVEILEGDETPIFRAGETSIIGLVGIAAEGDNDLTLITNLEAAIAKYGDDLPGTTILCALKSLYKDGTSPVLVVNVAESGDYADFISGGAVTSQGGVFTTEIYQSALGVVASPIDTLQAKIIAGIDKLKLGVATFGYRPNFIIAPGYSQVLVVGSKMRTVAATLKGKAIIDLYATGVTDAISERTTNYAYSDKRVIPCTPNMFVPNVEAEVNVEIGLSQLVAAEIISTHAQKGYWVSPSNRELTSVVGSKFPVIGSLTDTGADNQLLNAKGIVTIFKTQGSGTRLWGNWTSAFPASANLKGMIAASIVEDVIEETISRESLVFMDRNISYATLDTIVSAVQSFFNVLKGKGAIVDGRIWYTAAKNPVAQIATGQFVFDYDYCPHPSMDRLTYQSFQNIEYLNSLFQQ